MTQAKQVKKNEVGITKAEASVERFQWVLLQLQLPGNHPRPAGIILLDPARDRLHFRLSDLLTDEIDEDVVEIWCALPEDLHSMAKTMGGAQVLNWFEEHASHTFQVTDRRGVASDTPEHAVGKLFDQFVLESDPRRFQPSLSAPLFTAEELRAAQEKVGPLPSSTIRVLAMLRDPRSNYVLLEQVISSDSVLTAHLIRMASLAVYQVSNPARTLLQALQRLGDDAIRFHVLALSVRKVLGTGDLRKVWNHSIEVAQITRELAIRSSVPQSEAALLGLLHDIGQSILFALGESFIVKMAELRQLGKSQLTAETMLCGRAHPEIGAELLQLWDFPKDMVEAVRYHHQPTRSASALTAVLHVAETFSNSNEEIVDLLDHRDAMERLGLAPQALLQTKTSLDADLATLRFSAAA